MMEKSLYVVRNSVIIYEKEWEKKNRTQISQVEYTYIKYSITFQITTREKKTQNVNRNKSPTF